MSGEKLTTCKHCGGLDETVIRDEIKTRYCEEHGIPLLRIRYDQSDEVELLMDDLLENRKLYIETHNPLLQGDEYYSISSMINGMTRSEFVEEVL